MTCNTSNIFVFRFICERTSFETLLKIRSLWFIELLWKIAYNSKFLQSYDKWSIKFEVLFFLSMKTCVNKS